MSATRKLLPLLLLAALAVPLATADAQDAKPVPCTGMLLTDGAGDQDVAPIGGGGAGLPHSSQGPDNIDIRGLFFNLAPGADGKPVLTANIKIQDLTATVPPEAHEGHVRYLVDFDTMGDVAYLEAILSDDGWSFIYGVVTDLPDPLGGVRLTEAGTNGKVWEGKDGIIQIEMPASANIAAGTEMSGVITRVSLGDATVIFVSDQAPDGGVNDAVSFTVQNCPGGAQQQPGQQPPQQGRPQQPPQQGRPQQPPQQQSGNRRVPTQLTYTVNPRRDTRPPYAFRTKGKLIPPSGVSRSDACRGRVTVQVKRGKKTISSRRAQVKRDCTFADAVKFDRKRIGKARSLRWVVTFQGNRHLLPQKTKAQKIRVR